jgi:hypothetical protein
VVLLEARWHAGVGAGLCSIVGRGGRAPIDALTNWSIPVATRPSVTMPQRYCLHAVLLEGPL